MAVNPVDEQSGDVGRDSPPFAVPRASPSQAPAGRVRFDGNVLGDAVGDAVDGAVAFLAVSAALVRYVAETAGQSSRAVLRRLPLSARRPVLRRALAGPVAGVLAHPASAVAHALAVAADELVPGVTRAVLMRLDVPAIVREFVDLDRLAAMLDVDAVVARVDFDAVLDRVDLDALAERIDVSRIIDRVDLDAVVARVDLDKAVARVDLDAVVARVDLDKAVARVDLDAVVARVDLDAAVAGVDLDGAVDRVDVDRVIARTDIAGLARYVVQEIDLPGLLRASTGSVTSEMVRGVRVQGTDADRAVERVVDRLLRRQGRRIAPAQRGPETSLDDR